MVLRSRHQSVGVCISVYVILFARGGWVFG